MKTSLVLTDEGPPFFFIGEPGSLTLSLTFQQPGPREVDFSSLSLPDQKKILAHVLAEQLESSVSYKDLYTEYKQIFSQNAPTEPEPQKPAEGPAEKPVGAKEPLQIPEDYQDKEAKFQAKCKKLAKKSLKALKAALKKDNDTRVLQTIRNLELSKKTPRASVLTFIELEIRKLQREIVDSIENGAKPVTIKAKPSPQGETFVSDVVESEQKTVQLTPEMLMGDVIE